MSEFYWKGYKWRVGQKWGDTHPDKDNSWYGLDSVNIDEKGNLHLTVDYKPQVFDEYDIVKPFSIGLVSTIKSFGYGTFTFKCKMPCGTNLWPALWFGTYVSWPPEIDLIEGYTYNDTSYIKNCFVTKIESNVHYTGKDGEHKHIKAQGIPTIMWKLLHKDIDEFKCVWTKKSIKMYLNGVLFRIVTDKNILSEFNKCGTIYPIMNLEINTNYTMDDLKKYSPDFIIYDFKYKELN